MSIEKIGYGLDRIYFTITHDTFKDTGYLGDKTLETGLLLKEQLGDLLGRIYIKNENRGFQSLRLGIVDENLRDEREQTPFILRMDFSLHYPYQIQGYMNPSYLWRHENAQYKKEGFHGLNFFPIEIKNRTELSYKMFLKYRKWCIEKAIEIWMDVFNFEIHTNRIYFNPFSVEVTEEYEGHVTQFTELVKHSTGRRKTNFSDLTQTIYVNDFDRNIQFKAYQKASKIARIEWTFNGDKAKELLSVDNMRVAKALLTDLIDYAKAKLKFNQELITPLDGLKYLQNKSKEWKLTVLETKAILEATAIKSVRSNRNLILKLKRRGLIAGVKRGLYQPSDALRESQYYYNSIYPGLQLSYLEIDLDKEMIL